MKIVYFAQFTYFYILQILQSFNILQIEEAEEIAALNLAKFRQTQNNLSGAQERADVTEQALAKTRARSRASSLAPVSINRSVKIISV